ncbi:MAG: molybdopterin molybdenumtransferase MoeA, partial [Alphaproteobacteria bacterium]
MSPKKSSPLMPEEEGRARILAALKPIETVEELPLSQVRGRVLARPVEARRTQPPADMSAMDGYAVRAKDVRAAGARLRLIGESAAGHPFAGIVGAGETVRIFTGAEIPEGADAILIQENTERDGDTVVASAPVETGRHIRRRGHDFREKEIVLEAGVRLAPRHLALAAAADHGALAVTARPRIALFATGDELVAAGTADAHPGAIVDSNGPALAALIEAAGGRLVHRGRLKDTPA